MGSPGPHRLRLRAIGQAALMAAGLLLLTGCPDAARGLGVPPRSAAEALERINSNLRRLDHTLVCPALVSLRFRDADGRVRRFIGYEAGLRFRPPRCLRFDVRSLAGVEAQFGSDEQRYWLWIRPEANKLWWGRWDRVQAVEQRRLPVAPYELLEALLLRPLPEVSSGDIPAVLRIQGRDHRLIYVSLTPSGQEARIREIRLQPAPPYMPLEILDFLPDGNVWMHARLDHYARAGADGPYTPRRYVVLWPVADAELRLDVLGAQLDPRLDGIEFCAFPDDWRGAVERIDEPPGTPEPAETAQP